MISNYFKLINIIMNEYKLQKAKRKEDIADRLIWSVLKRIGWSVKIPWQIRNLIIDFLYRSFFNHPAMYALVSSYKSQDIQGQGNHSLWLDEGCEYIIETASQKLDFKVSCWEGIQDKLIDYHFRLFVTFLLPIQANFSRQRVKFEGNQTDIATILHILKRLKQNRHRLLATISNILFNVMKKRILILTCSHFVYCIIGDIVILSFFNHKVGLKYNYQQKRWKLSSNVLLWKKGVKLSRKKHWIRFSKHQIFEIQGPFINKVERMSHDESTNISYQVE